MVFEGDSLKGYILDFKDEKLVKIELPNVEECKVGKWIGEEEGYYSECSCCGASFLWEDYKCIGDWKYCPNCGTKISDIPTGSN